MSETEYTSPPRHLASFLKLLSYVGLALVNRLKKNLGIMLREADVFLGITFLAIGLLGFESDKYCDGNTADYLSCTRPSTYYFYDAVDIILVILGAFFVIVWSLKQHGKHHS